MRKRDLLGDCAPLRLHCRRWGECCKIVWLWTSSGKSWRYVNNTFKNATYLMNHFWVRDSCDVYTEAKINTLKNSERWWPLSQIIRCMLPCCKGGMAHQWKRGKSHTPKLFFKPRIARGAKTKHLRHFKWEGWGLNPQQASWASWNGNIYRWVPLNPNKQYQQYIYILS